MQSKIEFKIRHTQSCLGALGVSLFIFMGMLKLSVAPSPELKRNISESSGNGSFFK